MGLRLRLPGLRAGVMITLASGVTLLRSACTNNNSSNPDLVSGKKLFASKCGSCHVLSRAGTKGTVGPNLDQHLKAACALPASQSARGKSYQECIRTAIVDPYKFLPSGYRAGVMPNTFGHTLTPTEITALVNFLSSAAK